jgi:hypothetical protein
VSKPPPSPPPCPNLNAKDCDTWRTRVQRSAWFTNVYPLVCQDPTYYNDPRSCKGVITCAGSRIVGVVRFTKIAGRLGPRSTQVLTTA